MLSVVQTYCRDSNKTEIELILTFTIHKHEINLLDAITYSLITAKNPFQIKWIFLIYEKLSFNLYFLHVRCTIILESTIILYLCTTTYCSLRIVVVHTSSWITRIIAINYWKKYAEVIQYIFSNAPFFKMLVSDA